MAFAIWTFGRTTDPNTTAAVMLYVHSLMGDARPGEVDPAAIGPAVTALYQRIATQSARFHGPHRVDVALPAAIQAGKTGTATIRVLSAAGARSPTSTSRSRPPAPKRPRPSGRTPPASRPSSSGRPARAAST
jgi:hypothetical protein